MTPNILIYHGIIERLAVATRSCDGQPEEGGILLGAYRDSGMELISLSEAGPTDERSLSRFVRQDPRHQAIATAAWKASEGTVTVVGEWHTHPSGEPNPSMIDLAAWNDLAGRAGRPMAFIIAAPRKWRVFLMMSKLTEIRLATMQFAEHGKLGIVLEPRS